MYNKIILYFQRLKIAMSVNFNSGNYFFKHLSFLRQIYFFAVNNYIIILLLAEKIKQSLIIFIQSRSLAFARTLINGFY